MSNINASVSMNFAQTQEAADSILADSKEMEAIFENFNITMKRLGHEDVFVGTASETLAARYQQFKTHFDAYVSSVKTFSDMIKAAKGTTEAVNKNLADLARDLSN